MSSKTIKTGPISLIYATLFKMFLLLLFVFLFCMCESNAHASNLNGSINDIGITQSLKNANNLISNLESNYNYQNSLEEKEALNKEKDKIKNKDLIPFFSGVEQKHKEHQIKKEDKFEILRKKREMALFEAIASKSEAQSLNQIDNSFNDISINRQNIYAQNDVNKIMKNNTYVDNLSAYDKFKRDDFILENKVQSIRTPYLISQGSVIPSILLTGINSDLQGQVTAQITTDIYDSPRGRFLLIPKGSKIIGQYSNDVHFGQERVMLGFNRIIFPDGKSLNLGSMPALGNDGMTGLDADVNNHFMRLVTSSILLGGISTSIAISQKNAHINEKGELTNQGVFTQEVGQTLGHALAKVIERNLSVNPTLEVRSGFPFNVTLTKDIEFDGEYKAYEY